MKKSTMPTPDIEDTVQIAAEAHRGQTDKAGNPYILHPLKLMLEMDTEAEMKVALLHDVVEDSSYTANCLRETGFSDEVIDAVEHLTKRDGESYDEFVNRASKNEIAEKVKRADIEHNMDITRLGEVTKKDFDRLEKYHRAWKNLR